MGLAHGGALLPRSLAETPFDTTLQTVEGFFHANRTTNLAVYYHGDGLPTPWPLLAASMGLSTFMAFLGLVGESISFYKTRKTKEFAPQSMTKTIITIFGVLVATIRTGALIPLCIKAKSTGKVPAPSTLLVFLMSISPYMASPRKMFFLRYIACADMIIVFALMCSLVGVTKTSRFDYGSLYVAGGNCPTYVSGRCNDSYTNNWGTIGCQKLASLNDTRISTTVHSLEVTMANLQLTFGSIIAGYALYVVGFGLCVQRYAREDKRGVSEEKKSKPGREAQKAELRKCFEPEFANIFALLMAISAFLFVVSLTAAIIPIHIKGERNPAPVAVVDAIGKPYYIYNGGNYLYNWNQSPNDWSECFEITPPKSENGFMSTWWKSEANLISHLIAVV